MYHDNDIDYNDECDLRSITRQIDDNDDDDDKVVS